MVFLFCFVFLKLVVPHDMLVNFVNIQIHVILDRDHDVKTVAHVRLHFVMVHRYLYVNAQLVLQHRCAKYQKKMHVIRHHVNTVVRVY